MNSNLFNINWDDFVKSAINTVIVAVGATLYGYVTAGDFNVFTADWGMILSNVVNVAISAFIGFLGANFFANKEGKLMGVQIK